jgi:hypothetical protein
VTLPPVVQTAIDQAEARYASVSTARADLRQARYRAERNRLLGASLNASPSLARIEALRAIPKGSTIIMSDGGSRLPTVLAGRAGDSSASAPPENGGD